MSEDRGSDDQLLLDVWIRVCVCAEKVRAYALHCFHMQICWCYYSLFTGFGVCLFM